MRRVYERAQEIVAKYPGLVNDIQGIVELCADEIESGESIEHEIELALEDMNQRVEQHKEQRNGNKKEEVSVDSQVSG